MEASRDRKTEPPSITADLRVANVLGVPIHVVTMQDVLDLVDRAVVLRKPLQIGVVNAAKIVNMQRNPALQADVLGSDLVLADGMSVVWASRALRRSLPERVAGIDLMLEILRAGSRKGYRVFLLGATDEVLSSVAATVRRDFPGIEIAGTRNGYFREDQQEQVAEQIRSSHPDVLFVAITSPKKEQFLGRWSETLGVPVCHGVGGSFDVVAGKVQRAPMLWQRLGLEWLYRLKQEPGRLWKRYLVTNFVFCKMLASEIVRQSGNSTENFLP